MNPTLESGATNAAVPAAAPSTPDSGSVSNAAGESDKATAPPTPSTPEAPAVPDRRSPAERAVARASERIAAQKDAGGKNTSPPDAGTSTPGGEHPAGGTDADSDGGQGKPDPSAAATEPGTPDQPSDKSQLGEAAIDPKDWPAHDRELYAKLPKDAQLGMSQMYRRMQAGLTNVFEQLAETRKEHADLFNLQTQFDKGDAKGVISELAKRAGIEVFFDKPGDVTKIPEDIKDDPEKLVQWIRDQSTQAALAAVNRTNAENEKKAVSERAKETVNREFADAAKTHDDFASMRPTVLRVLNETPSLSVENAYRLATYDALKARVTAGEKAIQELTALKTQIERDRKRATTPPAAGTGQDARPNPQAVHQSPGERALARAQKRLATQRASV